MSGDGTPPARDTEGSAPVRTYAPDFLIELFRDPLDPGYADAAERRRSRPADAGRPAARVVSLLTLLAVGFLFAVAYRQTMAEEPERAQARAGLIGQITSREATVDLLARRADRLRDEVARQRDAALSDTAASRLRDLEAATGLARVRGDGLVVRVADAPAREDAVTGEGGPNLGRVLDGDLQEIANALWSAGAEGISINGQRLTSTSTIRAAGGAILVDYRPVIGPYEVSAVGPGDMERRFRDSSAARLLRSVAAEHGMQFGFRAVDDLTLPAAGGPQLRYARPSVSPTPTPSPSGAGPTSRPSGGGR